jgi:hypothetical protein
VTSDEPPLERFTAACSQRGFEVAEPLVLRPEALEEAAPVIESAELTLSCSFHVALTSLMLGVPTELASGNAYYEQKAAGLDDDFALPAQRTELRERALAVRARRARVEATLTARLSTAVLAGIRDRLGHHATQAVELRAQLAQLRLELQAHERQATDPWMPAQARLHVEQAQATAAAARDARAAEAARRRELEGQVAELEQRLAVVYGSRSWKLTAPLRATRSERRGSTL